VVKMGAEYLVAYLIVIGIPFVIGWIRYRFRKKPMDL